VFFNAPNPPFDAVMPAGMQSVLLTLFAIGGAGFLAFSLWRAAVTRSAIPVLVILGSVAAILYEPLGDTLEMAWYPSVGQIVGVDLWGRHTPLFIVLMFITYFAVATTAFLYLADRGFTARLWWVFVIGSIVGQVVMEEIILAIGPAWIYYGPQPFRMIHFPFWIAATAAVYQMAIGAGVWAIVHRLPARQHWLIVPATPLLFLIGHATAAFPGGLALYSTGNTALLWLGGAVSIVLSFTICWALSLAFVPRAGTVAAGAASARQAV
jgi:hypothetical protein